MKIKEDVNLSNAVTLLYVMREDKLISDYALSIYQWVCHSFLCQVICVFGTVTNILDMACFFKQGFKDPVNVTLFGLAISDLGSLVTQIWFNICMTPAVQTSDLSFDVFDMIYLGAGWPHCIFARVTSFLTAFLTLERCLCIAMPLKVTRILTPRRVAIVVVGFFILLITSVAPIYYVNRLAMVFKPARNKTILVIVQTEDRWDIIKVSLTVNNVVIPFGAFAVVIVCTAILLISLHRKTTWRKSAVVGNSENLMSRDQKVSKMILIISTVFIICFIPCCVGCVAMTLEPRIEMYGQYSNTFIVIFGASFILESTNSSVNIFVYYNMSSKFRATFGDLLRFNRNEQQKQYKQTNKL